MLRRMSVLGTCRPPGADNGGCRPCRPAVPGAKGNKDAAEQVDRVLWLA